MTAIEEFLHDLEPSVRTSGGVRRNAGTLYVLSFSNSVSILYTNHDNYL